MTEVRIDENRHREKAENETREERRGGESRAEEKRKETSNWRGRVVKITEQIKGLE